MSLEQQLRQVCLKGKPATASANKTNAFMEHFDCGQNMFHANVNKGNIQTVQYVLVSSVWLMSC